MPFIDRILQAKSLSIVGLEKNTGKTECLNYVLRRLAQMNKIPAVTSIGIDGEGVDQVTSTPKPEIYLDKGTYFTTLTPFYLNKHFLSEVCRVEEGKGSLGKWVTACARERGKVVLAGPSDTESLAKWVQQMSRQFGVDVCLVDGALSRKSPASPAVTQALVLATGASYSVNMKKLVEQTRFVCDCVAFPKVDAITADLLMPVERGVWGISAQGDRIWDTQVPAVLRSDQISAAVEKGGKRLFVAGVAGGALFKELMQGNSTAVEGIEVVVRDFTRIFAQPQDVNAFLQRGGKISCLMRTQLIAVCVNPVSAQGYRMNAEALENNIREAVNVPVYNIRNLEV